MTRHTLTASRTTPTVCESQRIVVDAETPERALVLAWAQLRLDLRRDGESVEGWTIRPEAP